MFCFGNWLVSIKREGPREAGIDAKIIPWKEIRGTARRPPLLLLWGPAEGHLIWETEEKGNRALLGYQGWRGTRISTRRGGQLSETSVAMARSAEPMLTPTIPYQEVTTIE